jgi:PilZ domain
VSKLALVTPMIRAARREPRIQFLSDVHVEYEGTGCEVLYRPPDLSPHGMFVNTSTHFLEGAIVNLRFRLTRSNVEVQTRGEVRYCLPGIGIGVEFVGIRPEAVRAIEKEIKASSRTRSRKT